jgi:hypothetical protein
MRRKTLKKGILKYTAFVPNTITATKAVSASALKKINYFLTNSTRKFKKVTKKLDKNTAKAIRSITRKRGRKY